MYYAYFKYMIHYEAKKYFKHLLFELCVSLRQAGLIQRWTLMTKQGAGSAVPQRKAPGCVRTNTSRRTLTVVVIHHLWQLWMLVAFI